MVPKYPKKKLYSLQSIGFVWITKIERKEGKRERGKSKGRKGGDNEHFPSKSYLSWKEKKKKEKSWRREMEGSIFPPLQIPLPSYVKQTTKIRPLTLPSLSFCLFKHTHSVLPIWFLHGLQCNTFVVFFCIYM
ncbi:hypothetical protein RND81_06G112100 [Saponaria officinalis]|uniref:Uncharacterized protein n=1 Tax=Saponaria officinalis TaxID=3572 RepID=A0AAW1K9A4_SAPOF